MPMKKLLNRWTLLVVSYLTVIGFLLAYLTLPKLPDGKAFVAKAQTYDVEVIRDDFGIPHVYGKTDADAAFGLGYAQSEDDFETLQTVLLATRGTLAAELGAKAAKTDFIVQFMGVWDAVNARYEIDVPEHIKRIAQAYADGVNLYAVENPGKVSRYFLPATAKDIIAGFTFKTPMFYGFDKALGNLVNPDKPHELAKAPTNNENVYLWQDAQNLPIGSQGIAVAPHRSEEGQTHLLVNSHQPLTGPVAWYEARVHSEEGWNMVGSTFPGAPVIIHGHNENLGWANTVNKPDLVDFYKMEINPEDPNQYKLDGKCEEFETKTAKMLVKLLGPIRWTFEKEIKISKHGPVMETDHGMYAARWAGMNEVRTLEFMMAINKASNQQEFESALKMNAMPSINYVYADKAGNIAHYYNAKFPNRIEGWEWKKILPGDRSELIWQGYRDYGFMPKTINPQSGLVFNANNPPWLATDGDDDAKESDYPKSMGIETFTTSRAFQINELSLHEDKISLSDLKRIKYDLNYHPESHQIKTLNKWLSLDIPNLTAQEQQAREMLASWNLSTHMNNKLAALAVLTLDPIQKANGETVEPDVITENFKTVVAGLLKHHGKLDVPYGDVMRLIRGDTNLAISGGPDVLRAVYGKELNDQGQSENKAGDGFLMFVSWDENGLIHSEAIHQFGSATLDSESKHFDDQSQMFVNHEHRDVLFNKADLLNNVSRVYQPGKLGLTNNMHVVSD